MSVPAWRTLPRAAVALLRALGVRVPRGTPVPWHDVELVAPDGRAVRGRLWLPAVPAPALVLSAGITPLGTSDPRFMRVAHALARAGRVVFAPEFALSRRQLDPDDVDRIVAAVLALDRDPRVRGGVAALGFSFGGSYTLLAAADPVAGGRLRLVATFGAYGDLVGLIQAATTGVTVLDGRSYPWRNRAVVEVNERLVDVLLPQVQDAVDGTGRDALIAVLAGARDPATLPDPAYRLHAVLTNRDPVRAIALVGALPQRVTNLLHHLSPVRVAGQVRAPLCFLHAIDDPVIPFAEHRRLSAAFPQARSYTVSLFTHMDFVRSGLRIAATLRDFATLLRFTAAVLAAGEVSPRSSPAVR